MALLQQAGAEAGRRTFLLFGHAICFFSDLDSSPAPLQFLLLPAPLLTHNQGWPHLGQTAPMTFAPWARHWRLTPWLSHLVMPHCFQQCWQKSREDRMASHLLIYLSTEFLLTSREPPCNLGQGSML